MRFSHLVLAAASVGVGLYAKDANACGGCFPPPGENESVVTDHRMVFAVSPTESTLYDQIEYSGSPSSFAWVLPIAGTVDVGLSANSLFTALDNLTSVTVQQPPTNCPGPPSSCYFGDETNAAAPSAALGGAVAEDAGVTVLASQVVGPYETVQLHPNSNTDTAALTDWLTQHNFDVPDDIKPVIAQYVSENFNFLALKLVPGQGVSSMRPVRVTTHGANVALPLRMIAAGTGATVGVTLWVVSTGRYAPTNFADFIIKDEDLTWDWTSGSSNYAALRAQHEAQQPNSWEIESVTTTAPYTVQNVAENVSRQAAYTSNPSGNPNPDGTYPDNDYLAVPAASANDAGLGSGQGETADQVQSEDYLALFGGNMNDQIRITRMRADLAHAALNVDLTIGADPDQTDVSRTRNPAHESGEPLCPVYNNCVATGQQLPRSQVPASSSGGGSIGLFTGSGGCHAASQNDLSAPVSLAFGFVALAVGRAIRKRRRGA